MRYTTIIDLTTVPRLWRNQNAIRLYYYMSCICGYHDADRDIVDKSLRQMAKESGLTLSAVRCAISVLKSYNLVVNRGALWIVRHWIQEGPISTPEEYEKKKATIAAREEQEAAQQQRMQEKREEDKRTDELRSQGKTRFMVYYEEYLMPKAEAGDLEAIEMLKAHKKTYEAHKAQIESEKKNG